MSAEIDGQKSMARTQSTNTNWLDERPSTSTIIPLSCSLAAEYFTDCFLGSFLPFLLGFSSIPEAELTLM